MAVKAILNNHGINQVVRNILELSERDDFVSKRDVLDENLGAGFDRIFLFTRQLDGQIRNASDAEVSINGLTNVQNSLQATLNELNNFFANGNPSHIGNAIANVDGSISAASWVFFHRPAKGSKVYGESVAAVQKAANSAIKKIEKAHSATLTQIEATDSRIGEQATSAEQIKKQMEATAAEHSAAVTGIEAAYKQFEAEAQTQFRKILTDSTKNLEVQNEKFQKNASDYLEKMSIHQQQAQKIVGIVGNIGITGNYNKRAEDEVSQANLWRGITVTLFGIGVVLVVLSLLLNFSGVFDLKMLIIRLAIAVTISIPAFYSARESARHRSNADKAKQTELELASLGPFLEQLPEEDRSKFRGELTPRYFGNEVEKHTVESPLDLEKVTKLLEAAAKNK